MSFQRYRHALALTALLVVGGCSSKAPAPVPAPPSPSASAAPAVAAPTVPVPVAGQCYARPIATAIMGAARVDCAQPHQSEVTAVGRLDLTTPEPPVAGAKELAGADAECRTKTAAYSGVPLGRRGATYELSVPLAGDWHDGARWFACELVIADAAPGLVQVATVQGSHAAGQTALEPHCYTLRHPNDEQSMTAAPCDKPHAAEFVGAVTIGYGGAAPDDDKTSEPYLDPCRDEIAAQIGVPAKTVDARWKYTVSYTPVRERWASSTPVGLCYFVLYNGRTVTGSILGGRGLK
ncbi:septum formation family protein [Dactylosporangium sp. McL0621]|uniref:septum formation family protein n=1 Tax=Dactylosporangium sp. McL0621 TaxID=3415678 RepID=UPI003CEC0D62